MKTLPYHYLVIGQFVPVLKILNNLFSGLQNRKVRETEPKPWRKQSEVRAAEHDHAQWSVHLRGASFLLAAAALFIDPISPCMPCTILDAALCGVTLALRADGGG